MYQRPIALVLLLVTLTFFFGTQQVFSDQEIEIYYLKNANNKTVIHFNTPQNVINIPIEVYDSQGEIIHSVDLKDYYMTRGSKKDYNTFIFELDDQITYSKLVVFPNEENRREHPIYNGSRQTITNKVYIENEVLDNYKIYPDIQTTIQNLNNEILSTIVINQGVEEVEQPMTPSGSIQTNKAKELYYHLENNKESLSAMTFNINVGRDRTGKINLDKIVEVIRESGADIIGIQEVERFSIRSLREDQLAYIAKKLSMYYAFGPNISIPLLGQYGNGILSKYPIKSSQNLALPSGKEQRGLLTASIEVGDKQINFLVTHLGLSQVERESQVKSILNYIRTIDGESVVLSGDFNARPESKEISMITQHLKDFAKDYENFYTYAYKSDEPNVRIDYIFVSQQVDVYYGEVLPHRVSDHQPVLAVIALP